MERKVVELEIKRISKIILNILVPIFMVGLFGWGGLKLLGFFLPFVIGWIVSMIANPLIHFLEKKVKIVRKLSSVVVIVGVLALVILALYFLIVMTVRELRGFIMDLPELYQSLISDVTIAYGKLARKFSFLPVDVEETLMQVVDAFGEGLGEWAQGIATSASGAALRFIPDLLVYTVVILLSSYLFLADHDKLTVKLRNLVPSSLKKYADLLKRDVKTVIYGYFLAQFKIMFVVAVIMIIGLGVLGVNHFMLIGVGISLLDFLPMFGTGTVLIPWGILKLVAGEYMYAAGLLVLYVLSQVIRQLIQPKIVGDSLGLPPLTTLFFLFLGYKFKGLAGMILAVPVGMIVIKFYEYGAFDSLIRNVKLLVEEVERFRKTED